MQTKRSAALSSPTFPTLPSALGIDEEPTLEFNVTTRIRRAVRRVEPETPRCTAVFRPHDDDPTLEVLFELDGRFDLEPDTEPEPPQTPLLSAVPAVRPTERCPDAWLPATSAPIFPSPAPSSCAPPPLRSEAVPPDPRRGRAWRRVGFMLAFASLVATLAAATEPRAFAGRLLSCETACLALADRVVRIARRSEPGGRPRTPLIETIAPDRFEHPK